MTSKTNGKIFLTEKLLHDSALKKLQLANTAASQVAESKESADSGFTPQACGFSPPSGRLCPWTPDCSSLTSGLRNVVRS